jgi:3-oxoacyl-[acyl-carrier-protein] synthase II
MRPATFITGVGAATPLGCDFATLSANLLAGNSAARCVSDTRADVVTRVPACLVDEVPLPRGFAAGSFRRLTRSEQFGVWSCWSALADAGWLEHDREVRVGLVLGSGGEWLNRWENDCAAGGTQLYEGRTDQPSLAGRIAAHLNLTGPVATVAAACASGNYAIAQARRWLELGLVDLCLAAAVETITPICRAAFNNLRALSRRVDDARRASRPFDRNRDGFVIAEGAAALLLERADTSQRRGARVYAEVAGFGATSDAFHMIIPSSDPAPAAEAMRVALADAGAQPHEVSYVNAHATSTPVGDKGEARALHTIFGPNAATIPVSSTKSMTGHLLSAAAAVEALACLVAIDRQAIPPTINLDEPDPDCDLCHVPHRAVSHRVELALSNSFGFGGSNTSLLLRKAA